MNRHTQEVIRYAINGVVATAVHYGVLKFNLSVLGFASAGLANLVAALFGISVSFVGSRYFVFPGTDEVILTQAIRFSVLYGAIAACHGIVLFIWTDLYAFDFKVGFLIATMIQVSLSYLGNKFLVFKK